MIPPGPAVPAGPELPAEPVLGLQRHPDEPAPWQDALPFLRGVAWLDRGRPVRADPADTMRLPWDTGERSTLPIGVRLEFTTETARAVEVRYRATVPGPTDALRDLAHGFALWDRHGVVTEVFTDPAAEAVVRIDLGGGTGPFTLHPPETQSPLILGLRGIGGPLAPAPSGPRWVVHGDSITEGWWSTRPAHGWPAVAGRALGWDTVNLGYAGAARGELTTAEQLAGLPADVLTLAFGTNCWSRVPFSAPLLYETTRAFLELVRQGHPRTPILLVSPSYGPTPSAPRTSSAPPSVPCGTRWSGPPGTGSPPGTTGWPCSRAGTCSVPSTWRTGCTPTTADIRFSASLWPRLCGAPGSVSGE